MTKKYLPLPVVVFWKLEIKTRLELNRHFSRLRRRQVQRGRCLRTQPVCALEAPDDSRHFHAYHVTPNSSRIMGTQKFENVHPCRKHEQCFAIRTRVTRHREPCQNNYLGPANFATPRSGARLPSGASRPPQKSSRTWIFPGQCNTLRRRRRPCTRRVSSLHCSLRRGL